MTNENILETNTTKRIVYGEGPKDARVVIVGEAPGAKEDRTGRPFVGPAGQLLDKLLSRSGIIRSLCYVTNVIKERPPNNNIDKFVKLSRKHPQTTEAYDNYLAYLKDEIEEINPNVIVAVGNVSLFALCGERGITKYRGSVMESTLIPGKKVIPLIHPAAALRQYVYQHYITFDLGKVKEEMEYPEIRKKERNYILRPSYEQCILYLRECLQHDLVAFDIEVSNEEVSCISFAYSEHEAISIPFYAHGKEYFIVQQEREIWKLITQILEDEDIRVLGQNTTFDSTFLFRKYGIHSNNIHDTMIAQATLYPDFPKGLDFITSIYTDMAYYKDDGKDFMKGAHGDEEKFWLYNARDSIVLMSAFPKMMEQLEKQGNRETYEEQRKLIPILVYLAERGIRMDVEGLEEQSSNAEERINELEEKLNELVGYEINPRSPKQLKEYFYGNKKDGGLGIKPYKNNGRPTTNEGALKRLARGTQQREPLEEASILLELRSLNKMKGTYFDMKLDDDGRLRSSMNPVGTRTGRLSSSKNIFGTGANIQNQPPIMKKFMLPDRNHIAYDIDLGQAENRIVAYISPEPRMIQAFEDGIDIHSRTASFIFGIPEDEIKEMNKEKIKSDIGTGDYTHRFWGKKANHAFNYGQGYKSFAYQVEIPEHEGKMIYDKYHSAYPGVRKYHNWVRESLSNRTLTNIFGRKYLFMDRWNYHLFQEAFAFIPQSTVADIINRRGLQYIYYNQDKFQHVKLINQIHDSIVVQIPISIGYSQHAKLLKQIMTNLETPLTTRGKSFIIPCDVKILKDNLLEGVEIGNANKLSENVITDKIKEVVDV